MAGQITTVLQFAQSMTWNGVHPIVNLVTQTYQTGVKLTKQAMAEVENQLHRLTSVEVQGEQLNLGKWFIDIFYNPPPEVGRLFVWKSLNEWLCERVERLVAELANGEVVLRQANSNSYC